MPKGASAGSSKVAVKVQDASAASCPLLNVKMLPLEVLLMKDEPVPQGLLDGVIESEAGAKARESVKAMLLRSRSVLVLVIVNSILTVSPLLAVSAENVFVSSGSGATKRVSDAGELVCGDPPRSAVSELVVLGYEPVAASAGTCRVTVKVHDPSDARLPPVKLSIEEPKSIEPEPQRSLCSSPVATRPVNVASRSSVKEISVAALPLSVLTMVKVRSTVAPGDTGSFVKDFVMRTASVVTSRLALALPELPEDVESSELEFSKLPTLLAVTSTLTVHVASAVSG